MKRGTKRLLLTFVVALALLWLADFRAYAQGEIGSIVGEIRVARLGFPPKAILVSLQIRGAPINSVYTDDQGRFGFYALPGGFYDLVIQDDDYTPVSVRVVLNPDISPNSYAEITLTPTRDEAKPRSESGIAGSNRDVIDLNEYRRNYPRKAVKEYEKGQKASLDGEVETAIRHLQKSLQLAPDFYPAHNELGRLYLAKSNFTGAEEEFKQVISLNQTDPEAYLNLGNVYLLTRHYDQALQNVQSGLQRGPRSALGKFLLGSVYARMGKLADAERALHDCLQLDPKMVRARLELVNVYLTQGNQLQAIAELKQFLRIAPKDPLVPKVKEVLARLEKAQAGPGR